MLALTHEAHVAILAFWEVAPPLIPAMADICLVAAGWRPDCQRQGRLAGRPGLREQATPWVWDGHEPDVRLPTVPGGAAAD